MASYTRIIIFDVEGKKYCMFVLGQILFPGICASLLHVSAGIVIQDLHGKNYNKYVYPKFGTYKQQLLCINILYLYLFPVD